MSSKNCIRALSFATSILNQMQPLDPYKLCKILDIEVITDKPLKQDGYLVCSDGCKIIFVSSRVTNRHRQKFIVAHELGHFLMHRSGLFACNYISDSQSQKINSKFQETEANDFASELLLPSDELKKQLPASPVHFAVIRDIAELFDISVTHAAMKAVQVSNAESEILLCYEGQKFKWYVTSNRSIYPSMIPKHCPIDITTAQRETDIMGAWDTLYSGSVHQEVFHTFGPQNLILLSQT